jgi:hypothetical protein
MPEGPEVETEKLHEAIKEELEHEGGSFLKRIALTTAILAAIAAIAALKAGATANEAIFLKGESAKLQSAASDQWTYYQAKGIKSAVQEASRTSWLAIGKEPPEEYQKAKERYAEEQSEIKKKAEELEKERDEKSEMVSMMRSKAPASLSKVPSSVVRAKWCAPNFLASASLEREVLSMVTSAPMETASFTAMWPSPPRPTTPTRSPLLQFQRRRGE